MSLSRLLPLLLIALVAFTWWFLGTEPGAEAGSASTTSPEGEWQEAAASNEATTPSPLSPPNEAKAPNEAQPEVQRGSSRDLIAGPVHQVQLLHADGAAGGASVFVLPFEELPAVMLKQDLWPFVLTTKTVQEYGQAGFADADGSFYLPLDGKHRYLMATSGGAVGMVRIGPDSGEQSRLTLAPPTRTLSVRLLYAGERPASGLRVDLVFAQGSEEVPLTSRGVFPTTDAKGEVQLPLTDVGARLLSADRLDQELAALTESLGYASGELDTMLGEPLQLHVQLYGRRSLAAPLELPLDLSRSNRVSLSDCGSLRVELHQADGTPLEGEASLLPSYAAHRRGNVREHFPIRDGSGEKHGLPLGQSFLVRVQVPGYSGTIEREVAGPEHEGESRQIAIVVEDWPLLHARLETATGEPLAGEQLVVLLRGSPGSSKLSASTDAQGRLRMFLPRAFHGEELREVELHDSHLVEGADGEEERRVRTAIVPVGGVVERSEGLGVVTLD